MPYKSRKTPSSIKILHLRPNDDRFGVNTPHNTDSTKSTIKSRVRAGCGLSAGKQFSKYFTAVFGKSNYLVYLCTRKRVINSAQTTGEVGEWLKPPVC